MIDSSMINPVVNSLMVVLIIGNILACLWLIWWTMRRRSQEAETTGHEWDGIQEYNNPLPRWWLWLFIITIVYALGYMVFYPALGNFAGSSRWSSTTELQQEQDQAAASFEARFAPLVQTDLVTLSKNATAMTTAKNLFANNCSTCHGVDAHGAKGFPNLTDNDWLWGGDPEALYQTIANGRKGTMPGWGAVLGQEGVEQAAAYVMSLSGHKAPQDWVDAGKERFATICVACHGADGKGNQTLGAPNLTDKVWVWGRSMNTVRETIAQGRSNEMPAHLPILGETKVKLLAAYIYSLSHSELAEPATQLSAVTQVGSGQ